MLGNFLNEARKLQEKVAEQGLLNLDMDRMMEDLDPELAAKQQADLKAQREQAALEEEAAATSIMSTSGFESHGSNSAGGSNEEILSPAFPHPSPPKRVPSAKWEAKTRAKANAKREIDEWDDWDDDDDGGEGVEVRNKNTITDSQSTEDGKKDSHLVFDAPISEGSEFESGSECRVPSMIQDAHTGPSQTSDDNATAATLTLTRNSSDAAAESDGVNKEDRGGWGNPVGWGTASKLLGSSGLSSGAGHFLSNVSSALESVGKGGLDVLQDDEGEEIGTDLPPTRVTDEDVDEAVRGHRQEEAIRALMARVRREAAAAEGRYQTLLHQQEDGKQGGHEEDDKDQVSILQEQIASLKDVARGMGSSLAKAEKEVEELRTKCLGLEEASQSEAERTDGQKMAAAETSAAEANLKREEAEATLAALRDEHATVLAASKQEAEAAIAAATAEAEAEIGKQMKVLESEVEGLRAGSLTLQKANTELQRAQMDMKEKAESDRIEAQRAESARSAKVIAEMEEKHATDMRSIKARFEHDHADAVRAEVLAAEGQHKSAVNALQRDHNEEQAGMQSKHAEALSILSLRHEKELLAATAAAVAEEKMRGEAAATAIKERLLQDSSKVTSEHAAEMEELRALLASKDAEVAAVRGNLDEASAALAAEAEKLRGDLARALAEKASTNEALGRAEEAASKLSRDLEGVQVQLKVAIAEKETAVAEALQKQAVELRKGFDDELRNAVDSRDAKHTALVMDVEEKISNARTEGEKEGRAAGLEAGRIEGKVEANEVLAEKERALDVVTKDKQDTLATVKALEEAAAHAEEEKQKELQQRLEALKDELTQRMAQEVADADLRQEAVIGELHKRLGQSHDTLKTLEAKSSETAEANEIAALHRQEELEHFEAQANEYRAEWETATENSSKVTSEHAAEMEELRALLASKDAEVAAVRGNLDEASAALAAEAEKLRGDLARALAEKASTNEALGRAEEAASKLSRDLERTTEEKVVEAQKYADFRARGKAAVVSAKEKMAAAETSAAEANLKREEAEATLAALRDEHATVLAASKQEAEAAIAAATAKAEGKVSTVLLEHQAESTEKVKDIQATGDDCLQSQGAILHLEVGEAMKEAAASKEVTELKREKDTAVASEATLRTEMTALQAELEALKLEHAATVALQPEELDAKSKPLVPSRENSSDRDAELAEKDAEVVNLKHKLEQVVRIYGELKADSAAKMEQLVTSSQQSAVKANEAIEGGQADKRRVVELESLVVELRQAVESTAEREAAALAEAVEAAKLEAEKSRQLEVQSKIDASMLAAKKIAMLELERKLAEVQRRSKELEAQVTEGAAREEVLLASTEKFGRQQLTLDEYRAKAQSSVKAANARTLEVTQLRHNAEESAAQARQEAEAAQASERELYRELCTAKREREGFKEEAQSLGKRLADADEDIAKLREQVQSTGLSTQEGISRALDFSAADDASPTVNKQLRSRVEELEALVKTLRQQRQQLGAASDVANAEGTSADASSVNGKKISLSHRKQAALLEKAVERVEAFRARTNDLESQVEILTKALDDSEEARQRAVSDRQSAQRLLLQMRQDGKKRQSSIEKTSAPKILHHGEAGPQVIVSKEVEELDGVERSQRQQQQKMPQRIGDLSSLLIANAIGEDPLMDTAISSSLDASSIQDKKACPVSVSDAQLFYHTQLHSALADLEQEKAILLRKLDEQRAEAASAAYEALQQREELEAELASLKRVRRFVGGSRDDFEVAEAGTENKVGNGQVNRISPGVVSSSIDSTPISSDTEGNNRLRSRSQSLGESGFGTSASDAATNLAYLKHVVLAFATPPPGDEQQPIGTRQRLLPVLAQLLNLTAAEESAAAAAAERQQNLLRAGARAIGTRQLVGSVFGGIGGFLLGDSRSDASRSPPQGAAKAADSRSSKSVGGIGASSSSSVTGEA